MATVTAKINSKNMDYFKFKKIVIDGSRDDYDSCSREIRSLCDAVQTLSFRYNFTVYTRPVCVVLDTLMAKSRYRSH